jgi:hypothetical protein
MMKGQYRIVSELILFGVGIMITTYVLVNFGNVKETISGVTLADQLESVADSVSVAMVAAYNTENSTIRMIIPTKLSDEIYRIAIRDADGGKLIVSTIDGKMSIERQLFNMDYDNIVLKKGVINNSEVVSTGQLIEIVRNEKITLRRLSQNATL